MVSVSPSRRALEGVLAAVLATLAVLLFAAPASAVTQTTTDPDDPYQVNTYDSSTDVRAVTWDSTSSPGDLLLTVELGFLPNAGLGVSFFLDTDRDGRANYTVYVTNDAQYGSHHPDFADTGGVARYFIRTASKSTTTCQSNDDNILMVSPFSALSVPAHRRLSDQRTVFTIPVPLADIGNPASLVWGAVARTETAGGAEHLIDLVPEGTNIVTDFNGDPVDPRDPGMSDSWFCSPGNDGSFGERYPMDRGVLLTLRGDAPTPPRPYDPPPIVSIGQTPDAPRPDQPIQLTANASDPGGAILHYAWDLDGDGTYDDAPEQSSTTTRFATEGSHTVGVRVIDTAGNASFARRTIDVVDRPAALTLTSSSANPLKSEKFTVTAAYEGGSTINDSDIQWGFDSDRGGDDDDPYGVTSGRTWTLGFGAPGTYVIKARVTDASGKVARGRITITVPNQPPVFREFRNRAKQTPDNAFNKDPLVKGKPIILQALLSDDNLTRPRVEWDLDGDGGYDDAVGEQIEKTYPDAGEKKIGVRIVDADGLVAFGDSTFEVRDSAEAGCSGKAGNDAVRAVGCFTPDPKDKAIKVTKDPIKLNGLDLIPKGGAQLNVQAVGGLVFTTGPGTVQVKAGTVLLFEGRFQMDANCDRSKQDCLVGRFASPALANLKGFPIQGNVDVYLTPEGTRTHVNVDVLGSIGLGITANADVLTTDKGGLVLNGLEVRSPMIPLGKLNIGQFFVVYDGKTRRWTGGGNITLPTPQFTKLTGDFAFSEITGFERAHGEVDGLNIPLDEGTTYLQRIAFTIEVKGFSDGHPRVRLGGGIGISAGPRVAGVDIATADGDFLVTFGDPFGIDLDGRISIAGYDVMGGTLSAYTNGTLSMHGFIGFGLPFPSALKGKRQDATKVKVSRISPTGADVYNPLFQVVSVRGEANAWVEPNAFNMEASITAKVIGITLARAEGLLSSKGIAGCGEIVGIRGGFGYDYATDKTDLFGNSCDLAPYRPVRTYAPLDDNGAGLTASSRLARARAAGDAASTSAPAATAVDVAPDQKALVLKLDGDGGQPVVTLVSPSGQRFVMSATDVVQTDDFFAARNPLANETYIGVRAPKAGRWQIEPQPGSVAIAAVAGADVLPQPEVKASVSGTGATRTIAYDVKQIAGQAVSFVEQGDDTHRTVGVAGGAHGSITFTPQDGNDTSRQLIAIVTQNGIDRAHIPLTAFVAPPLSRPAAPTRLRARRAAHGNVVLSWKAVRGISHYTVVARTSDGRSRYFPVTRTTLKVPRVGRLGARFVVRALQTQAKTSAPVRLRLARHQARARQAKRAVRR
jgi:hypothetical protein